MEIRTVRNNQNASIMFTQQQIEKARMGYTRSRGGLNICDLRILAMKHGHFVTTREEALKHIPYPSQPRYRHYVTPVQKETRNMKLLKEHFAKQVDYLAKMRRYKEIFGTGIPPILFEQEVEKVYYKKYAKETMKTIEVPPLIHPPKYLEKLKNQIMERIKFIYSRGWNKTVEEVHRVSVEHILNIRHIEEGPLIYPDSKIEDPIRDIYTGKVNKHKIDDIVQTIIIAYNYFKESDDARVSRWKNKTIKQKMDELHDNIISGKTNTVVPQFFQYFYRDLKAVVDEYAKNKYNVHETPHFLKMCRELVDHITYKKIHPKYPLESLGQGPYGLSMYINKVINKIPDKRGLFSSEVVRKKVLKIIVDEIEDLKWRNDIFLRYTF